MTIRYTLSNSGKRITEWLDQNRKTPPAKQMVLVPVEILQRQELKGYFRRARVLSQTETKRGYDVQLEAVKMTARLVC